MLRNLERRVRRLEIAARSRSLEIWVEQDDGSFLSHSGARMTRKAFFRLHPPGSPDIFVIQGVDAKL
jgi:hypothetical protein